MAAEAWGSTMLWGILAPGLEQLPGGLLGQVCPMHTVE